jgi:proline dehydrogenase
MMSLVHSLIVRRYVPFGPLEEVMPYLIRRAQENSDIMGGVGKELGMLEAEIRRRWFGGE